MPWLVKCTVCGHLKLLLVGYDIEEMKRVYVFCPSCQKSTFHEIVRYVDSVEEADKLDKSTPEK